MNVLKPDNLALLYRTYIFAGHNVLSIGMLGMFPFNRAGYENLLPEVQLWGTAAAALAESGIQTPLDEGWAKPCGEFMVYGAACAPNGNKVQQLSVRATLGRISKELYVFGDRTFGPAGLPSQPLPFSRMPLSANAAFGGAGFADNPAGKGFVKVEQVDGSLRRPLPNVELPRQLMTAEGDNPQPATLGALAADNSARTRHLGHFDDRWLKQHWPNMPDDTRLEYFLAAAPDQHMTGYWNGNESFELHNMHPTHQRLSGKLPGLRARCFVNRRLGDQRQQFSEIEARPETIWLFPDHECGIVLYRATLNPADGDADDVLHVMAEWENLADAPRSLEHYEQSFRLQLEPSQPPVLAETPEFQAPEPVHMPQAVAVPAVAAMVVPELPPEFQELEKLTEDLQAQIRTLLNQHGLTEADLRPLVTEVPEATLADVEQVTAQLEAQTKALLQEHGLTEADIIKPPAELPETTLEQIEATTWQMEHAKKELLKQHGMTESQLQTYLERELGQEGAVAIMRDGPLALAQQESEAKSVLAGLPSLPVMPELPAAAVAAVLPSIAVPAMSEIAVPEKAKLTREEVVSRHSRRENFAGFDLSGLDLSELDLSEADFTEALLENTSFQKSVLIGARFEQALLQAADFSEADLSGARLNGASGAQAVFAKAKLAESDLSQADFSAGDFSDAVMSRAVLTQTTFDGASMDGLRADGCQAAHANFNECTLKGADLSDANLQAARFNEAKAMGANLAGSLCEQSEFYGSNLSGAIFKNASLRASRAGKGSFFDGASLVSADMANANWEGASAMAADFSASILDNADLTRLQAMGARFGNASAKGTNLAKADLAKADLTGINLFKGSLRKTRVDDAVFHFANLYGVDFEGTTVRASAVQEADIGQTILAFRPPLA